MQEPLIHFASEAGDTPESLFTVRTDARPGLHLDALNCTLARARAVTSLLSYAQSAFADGPSVNQAILTDALWAVEGLIAEAQMIAEHCSRTAEPAP